VKTRRTHWLTITEQNRTENTRLYYNHTCAFFVLIVTYLMRNHVVLPAYDLLFIALKLHSIDNT